MTILLETITPPGRGAFTINFSVSTEIVVSAEEASRAVSVFAGNRIADLLHGGAPTLVLKKQGAFWRVPVILSSRSYGQIGAVGAIDVDAQTGVLVLDETILHEIETNAERLAAGAAL
ncbi:MAG TPA: hypothetical protein GYA08_03925 [Chloroflexi bacterium]|nr:hypothetical protein [Chloroflexota bacterium]